MKKLIIALAVLAAVFPAGAQVARTDRSAFSTWSIGAGLAYDGVGLFVATPLGGSTFLRADYRAMPIISHRPLEAFANVVELPGNKSFYMSPERVDRVFNSHSLRLLVDWSPFRSGDYPIYLTFGAVLRNPRLAQYTEYYDREALADFGYAGEDLQNVMLYHSHGVFRFDESATVHTEFIRPAYGAYIGVSFGRLDPSRRVSIWYEMGAPVFFGKAHGVNPNAEVLDYDGHGYYFVTREYPYVTVSPYLSVNIVVRLGN